MYDIPILYIIFNRLDTVKQTFSKIQQLKPKTLFIAADGPRVSRPGEDVKCKQVRDYVMSQINWDCDVHTLFREENLGCGVNISKSISWFFENVEMGIIMEDDILVTNSFFTFMQNLLEYYKDNPKIMHIAGYNPLITSECKNDSYFFLHQMHCWGWGTWRRAWKHFNYILTDTHDFCNSRSFKRQVREINARGQLECLFDMMEHPGGDIWDAQWEFAIYKNKGICITPCKNLITNVGAGPDSTHSMSQDMLNEKRFELEGDIVHPKKIRIHKKYNREIRFKTLNLRKTTLKMFVRYYIEKWIKLPLRKIFKVNSLKDLICFKR